MKIGSRSPNSYQIVYLFIYSNDTIHEVLSESIIWFKSLGADKLLLSQNLTFKVPIWPYFPFGFEGRMWDLIVSVPDHCLSFYFENEAKITKI